MSKEDKKQKVVKKSQSESVKKALKKINSNDSEKNKYSNLKTRLLTKKNGIILAILLVLVILIIVVVKFLIPSKKGNKFALNEAYNFYPEEVRKLYSNMVSVSCNGDLHLDIKLDGGVVDIDDIPKENLLGYLFSYMDKNNLLDDKIDNSVIREAERNLFEKRVNLVGHIDDYAYGDYIYDSSFGKTTRKENKCTSDITYVTHLYGYFWDENKLSLDIDVGYLKDGVLYDYNDKELGKYDGDVSKLGELMNSTSYYRMNYVKNNDVTRLVSVEWKNRS